MANARKAFKQGGSIAITLPPHQGIEIGDIVLIESPRAGVFVVKKLDLALAGVEAQ